VGFGSNEAAFAYWMLQSSGAMKQYAVLQSSYVMSRLGIHI
jgi:hypothetical protein